MFLLEMLLLIKLITHLSTCIYKKLLQKHKIYCVITENSDLKKMAMKRSKPSSNLCNPCCLRVQELESVVNDLEQKQKFADYVINHMNAYTEVSE